ncbi:MAG TPA: polysaccharide biosynthesis protein [Arsenophonus sp.]
MKTLALSKTRLLKLIVLLFVDVTIMFCSYWGALWLRLDRDTPLFSYSHWFVISLTIVVSIFFFIRIGFYRAIIRYVNISIFKWTFIGSIVSSILLIALSLYQQAFLPRTVPIIYFFLLVIFLCGSRIFYRNLINIMTNKGIPVLIYGAGESGRQLVTILREHKELNPICFIDDNPLKNNHTIQGLRVYSINKVENLVKRKQIKKILLAMPQISNNRKKEILQYLEKFHCELLTIPNFNELVNGTAKISALKRVSIADILGREQISPMIELLSKNITGKNILVTGAGGSIGSELCRQIIEQNPTQLVLYEISEFSLYSIHYELMSLLKNSNINIIPILGDIKNKDKLRFLLRKFNIHTIYHAAAYKHVPLVEYNIIEGIQNNIFGTLFLAEAANDCQVEKFVLISTDKAVRPTNVMGATKRFAELILQALANTKSKTHYSMVRFGNVLGSSGSVVPLFEKQIAQGGPITLTHKNITRYFMTIPEAAQLVIQAGAMGKSGDVFVLDMGNPVKIYDLAIKMINLSGLSLKDENNPEGDIEIQITGLRPGEKLYEELLIGDNIWSTSHSLIMTAEEKFLDWEQLIELINNIDYYCHERNLTSLRKLLLKAPLDFNPKDKICDLFL